MCPAPAALAVQVSLVLPVSGIQYGTGVIWCMCGFPTAPSSGADGATEEADDCREWENLLQPPHDAVDAVEAPVEAPEAWRK